MRALPRSVVIVLAVVLVGLIALTLYSSFSTPPSSGPWQQAYSYPLQTGGVAGVVGQSCVESAGYVYCIGGQDATASLTTAVYYAPASTVGVGNWTLSANPYPQPIVFESCSSASGYVYCVGRDPRLERRRHGRQLLRHPLALSGVGAWAPTTPFPIAIDAPSCASAVGDLVLRQRRERDFGDELDDRDLAVRLVRAHLLLWDWELERGRRLPCRALLPSCSSLGSYVYCVGGENAQDSPQNATYYSYVTPSGMGAWAPAPAYPIQAIAQSCVTSDSSLFCVGGLQSGGASTGSVYFCRNLLVGARPWQSASSYPAGAGHRLRGRRQGSSTAWAGTTPTPGVTGDSYYALLNGPRAPRLGLTLEAPARATSARVVGLGFYLGDELGERGASPPPSPWRAATSPASRPRAP